MPPPPAFAQVAINVEWQQQSGAPATEFDYSVSDFDVYENLYVAGNSVIPGQEANFWLIKYDPEGNVIWETTIDFDAGDDYVTSLVVGSHGDVWVAGPSFNVSDSSFDYAAAMIDSSGSVQWQSQYNGTWGKDDFPVSMRQNLAGDLFVAGTTEGDTTGRDYTIMKLDATDGSQQWTNSYDYANFDDVGVGLELDEDDQTVTMSGASASTANSYDFATVKFNMSNGEIAQSNRYVAGVQGYNSPVAICKDDDGNVYVTGRAVGSSSFDIQTIKLDSTLSLQWAQSWDGDNLEDGGRDIKVDYLGNVYVTGYRQNTNLGYEYVTLKYDQTGLLLWEKSWAGTGEADTAQTTYLALDANNDVYVTGSVQNAADNTSYLYTIVYDTDGNVQWGIEYQTPGSAEGVPSDMRVNLLGDVYLTGKTSDVTGNEFVSMKYKALATPNEYAYDSLGNPVYVRDQLVVRFNPAVIDSSFVDNLDLMYGTVNEIITDTSLIELMDDKLNANDELGNWKMTRVYTSFTTTMTEGISRYGDTISVPPLWSAFVLRFPENSNSPETSEDFYEIEYLDSLNTIGRDYLYYSCLNAVMQLFTNDPEWSKQVTMASTTYPNGSLNIEKAWDFILNNGGTLGSQLTVVGLIDDGVWAGHADLGAGGNHGGLLGSVIWGLDDYGNGIPPSPVGPNSYKSGHGTNVAGYIGGFRDNNIGIAGIAGGDWDNSDVNKRIGVKIYSTQVKSQNLVGINTAHYVDALHNMVFPRSGSGLPTPVVDIINSSLGLLEDDLPSQGNPNVILVQNLFRDEVRLANQMGAILVNARGSRRNSGNFSWGSANVFPATIYDSWGLSVGCSDLAGNLLNIQVSGGQNSQTGIKTTFRGYYGKDMDVLAPGINEDFNGSGVSLSTEPVLNNGVVVSDYKNNFAGGSSIAAAYTTGVVSLLDTWSPITLYQEDFEHLIEYGAKDVTTNISGQFAVAGYDNFTGWGNVDAEATIKLLSPVFPRGQILHRTISPSVSASLIAQNAQVRLPYDFDVFGRLSVLTVDVYEYDVSETVQLPPGFTVNAIGPGTSRSGVWPRNGLGVSNLLGARGAVITGTTRELIPEIQISAEIINQQGSQVTVRCKGYYYEIKSGAHMGKVLPSQAAINNPELSYSLLLIEQPMTSVEEAFIGPVRVYPNPSKNTLFAKLNLSEPSDISASISSIDGKVIRNFENGAYPSGVQHLDFDIQTLSPGFYFLSLEINGATITKKFTKN